MSWGVAFANLVAYSLQIGMLVAVGAAVPVVLRLRQPGARLVYWQLLLAACLLLPLQPWRQSAVAGTVQVTTGVATAISSPHSSAMLHLPQRSELAVLLVLAGVAIRLAWLAIGFWKLRRYRRHSHPLQPAPAWSVEASLLLSDEIASPVTFGWRKPVVLLPANFPGLTAQMRDAILCHEVMHVRRSDWLLTVAEEVIRAIFWFHPAIWWLLGEIGLAREQEVDRLAIEITQEREHYMDALLAIAGAGSQLDLAPAPLFLRRRHLRHRVVLILEEARMSKTRIVSTLTTGLAVLLAACWMITGAFPLTAEPQSVADAAGIAVFLNGSQVLHRSAVHYPASALQHGVQGSVSVEVKLDSTGNVSDARVLSGPDELRSAVLQSVLDWHFTRDAANSTREVEVAFELPAAAVAGVTGGITEGVRGGVTGVLMDGALRTYRDGVLLSVSSGPLDRIVITGLSDQARDELLATLPVHEGDTMTADDTAKTERAVRAFDEHLTVRWMLGANGAKSLLISAPGAERLPWGPGTIVALGTPPPTAGAFSENPQRIRVGGNVQATNIVSKIAPVYPELAKSARVQGIVHLAVVIAKDGTVQEIHALGGPALLIQSALDAVRQWVYRPTLLNGEPVAVETVVDVHFTLSQ